MIIRKAFCFYYFTTLKRIIRYFDGKIYKPILAKYLASTHTYRYRGVRLVVPPEVFHPAFFFSTKLLLKYLGNQPLRGKSLLELGAGSGLISIYAAKKGALVTASDINPIAIQYLEVNRQRNKGVDLEIILSDLFTGIPPRCFDLIAINPPYYKKKPASPKEFIVLTHQNLLEKMLLYELQNGAEKTAN